MSCKVFSEAEKITFHEDTKSALSFSFYVYDYKVNVTIIHNSLSELWLVNGSVDLNKHCLFCPLVLNLHYCFVFIPRERRHDMKCNLRTHVRGGQGREIETL